MEIQWKKHSDRYGPPALRCYLGKWHVGSVVWSLMKDKRYEARCRLPDLKDRLGNYELEADAQERVEKAVRYWLKGLHEVVAE